MRPSARDTIAAISSPVPHASASQGAATALGRAIVRLSGPRALALAELVFHGSAGVPPGSLSSTRGWRRVSGSVKWREHVLPAHAYVMRSPRSYTREDVVELHVPALPWLLSALLEELLAGGARLAQPGEFTRRAFENGRIKLDQAEAVGALIASRSADEARVHAARLRAHAHGWRTELRREVEELLALVELGLDFAHEDAGVLSAPDLRARLEGLRARFEEFCGPAAAQGPGAAPESAILTAGLPRILLLGPANAGKSTLFNTLLGRQAAIVSPQPHTTRDTVEATLAFPGAGAALLIDSAGWSPLGSQSSGLLSDAAWEASLCAARAADVILLLLDRSVPAPAQKELHAIAPFLAQMRPAALAVLWSKCDLPPAPGWTAVADPVSEGQGAAASVAARFEVSAVSGTGIAALREFLDSKLTGLSRDAYLAAEVAAHAAARRAAEALARASAGLALGHGEDVVAVELREALHAFWEADGVLMKHDAITEATLDKIFSRFCIGK